MHTRRFSFKSVEREHLFRGISLMTSQHKKWHGYKICYKYHRFNWILHGMRRYHLERRSDYVFAAWNSFFFFGILVELSQLSCNRCTSIIIITVVIVQFLRLSACRPFFSSAFVACFSGKKFPIHGAYHLENSIFDAETRIPDEINKKWDFFLKRSKRCHIILMPLRCAYGRCQFSFSFCECISTSHLFPHLSKRLETNQQ